MNNQQEQMKQNPNQEIKYISGFLNKDEVVNEVEFDEPIGEQEVGKLADNYQNKPEEEEKSKKTKRPRKTIEQEIAELDAKRERLMEKKRKQEAHEKIVFGGLVISLLKHMKNKNEHEYNILCNKIICFVTDKQYRQIVIKIINSL